MDWEFASIVVGVPVTVSAAIVFLFEKLNR